MSRHWRTRIALLAGGAVLAIAALPALAADSETATGSKEAYKQLPLRRDGDDAGMGWTVLAFLAALGAIAFIVSARVRRNGLGGLGAAGLLGNKVQRLEVLERRSLNTASTVCLVRWDGEELLLGCTAQSVSVLSRRPAPAPDQVQG